MSPVSSLRVLPVRREALGVRGAISGTSLLTSARRVLVAGNQPNYFEFRAACQFIEAVLFHDQLLLVGTAREKDAAFLSELQARFGDVAVTVIQDQSDEWQRSIDTPTTKRRVAFLLRKVFGRRAPALGPLELNARPSSTRFADDHQVELIRILVKASGNVDALTAVLYDEYVLSLTAEDRRYFVNYLFRMFLHAAVAAELQGTAVADGIRTIVLRLIQSKLNSSGPKTLTVRLYDSANEALRMSLTPFISGTAPFIPLGVLFSLGISSSKNLLDRVQEARERLSTYRDAMNAYQNVLLSPETSLAEKQAVRVDVLGAGAECLGRIASQLSLQKLGTRGLFEKMWLNSVDSIFGETEVSAGAEGPSVGLTGSALGVVRAARRTWIQQRRENAFAPLVEMINEIASRPRVFEDTAAELRVENLLDSADEALFEESLLAASPTAG
jgi:hypothetical protein